VATTRLQTVSEVRGHGRRAAAFAADVSDAGSVTALCAAVERELGPVGILVNNAGIARR